jgi:RNA recognition motif-containing protein
MQKRRRNRDDDERGPTPEPEDKLKDATTLYVGNLSFYTTEEQIHELFSKYVSPVHDFQVPALHQSLPRGHTIR